MSIATTFVLPAITSVVFLVWFILDRSVEAGAMLVISIAALVVNAVIKFRNNNGRWKKVKKEQKGWLYKINVRTQGNLDNYIGDLKSELWGIDEYRVYKSDDEFKVISVLMAQPIELPEMYKTAREIGSKHGVKIYSCEDHKSKYGLFGDGIEDGIGYH